MSSNKGRPFNEILQIDRVLWVVGDLNMHAAFNQRIWPRKRAELPSLSLLVARIGSAPNIDLLAFPLDVAILTELLQR